MSPLFVHTLRPRGGPVVRGTELVLSQAAALRRGPSEASGESHLSPPPRLSPARLACTSPPQPLLHLGRRPALGAPGLPHSPPDGILMAAFSN